MKYVTLAPYVRLCVIAGLGPWVLMKLGRESLAGNFNLIAQPRKIKQNKTKWQRQSTSASFFYSTSCKEERQGKNIKSSNGYMKFFQLGYFFLMIVRRLLDCHMLVKEMRENDPEFFFYKYFRMTPEQYLLFLVSLLLTVNFPHLQACEAQTYGKAIK